MRLGLDLNHNLAIGCIKFLYGDLCSDNICMPFFSEEEKMGFVEDQGVKKV